jgi:hypothetical protein
MTSPLGAADFFALEAGECLDRLAVLADQPDPPPTDEVLRISRVLRGSALMAGQTPIARAAAGLEALARAYRDHRLSWDAGTKEQVAQAIEEFRLLVRRAREWSEDDTSRATKLGRDLESLAGRPPATSPPTPSPPSGDRGELHTGVRAFVAREGALIASALDRAARALRTAPNDREPLYNVIRRMQSLRGLAELGDLVPLPEILDGIELAVGDLTRLFAPPPDVDQVMEAASHALTRISRDVAERGLPVAEADEARRFSELLLRAFAVERDVVPIESLYHSGDPEPYTRPVTQPQFAPPQPLGPLELVSHGEHLCQTADLIENARSGTQRDLRLYHLLGALRSAAVPTSDPVAGALGIFAKSAQEALGAGVASQALKQLIARLREAGELLRAVVESDDRMLISRRLLDVAHRLDGLRAGEPEAGEPVPIESLQYDVEPTAPPDLPIVPIQSLAPDEVVGPPAAAVAPVGGAAPSGGIEASFRTFGRLLKERGATKPSLAAFVAAGAAPPPAAPEPETVAIDTLCYRGQAALERANAVRQQLAAELSGDTSIDQLKPLLQELLDLVPLALEKS